MEPTAYDGSILGMLAIDSDPFRNGTDCCCIVHTNAGRYKQALNKLIGGTARTRIAGEVRLLS